MKQAERVHPAPSDARKRGFSGGLVGGVGVFHPIADLPNDRLFVVDSRVVRPSGGNVPLQRGLGSRAAIFERMTMTTLAGSLWSGWQWHPVRWAVTPFRTPALKYSARLFSEQAGRHLHIFRGINPTPPCDSVHGEWLFVCVVCTDAIAMTEAVGQDFRSILRRAINRPPPALRWSSWGGHAAACCDSDDGGTSKKSSGVIGFSRSRPLSNTACWCLAGISPVSFQLWTVEGGILSAEAIARVPPNRRMIFEAYAMSRLCATASYECQRLFRMALSCGNIGQVRHAR